MNMQEIGYYLYMQQQEEEQQKKHIKVNVNDIIDLVREKPTTEEEEKHLKYFS